MGLPGLARLQVPVLTVDPAVADWDVVRGVLLQLLASNNGFFVVHLPGRRLTPAQAQDLSAGLLGELGIRSALLVAWQDLVPPPEKQTSRITAVPAAGRPYGFLFYPLNLPAPFPYDVLFAVPVAREWQREEVAGGLGAGPLASGSGSGVSAEVAADVAAWVPGDGPLVRMLEDQGGIVWVEDFGGGGRLLAGDAELVLAAKAAQMWAQRTPDQRTAEGAQDLADVLGVDPAHVLSWVEVWHDAGARAYAVAEAPEGRTLDGEPGRTPEHEHGRERYLVTGTVEGGLLAAITQTARRHRDRGLDAGLGELAVLSAEQLGRVLAEAFEGMRAVGDDTLGALVAETGMSADQVAAGLWWGTWPGVATGLVVWLIGRAGGFGGSSRGPPRPGQRRAAGPAGGAGQGHAALVCDPAPV
jgi:hypothetical protein